jgi:predicted aspartyl protease
MTRASIRAALLVLAAAAPCVDAACKLVKIGEIPVTVQGVPVAPVSLDGHPARLVVDTGAYSSLLWHTAVAAFGLKRFAVSGGTLVGAGGRTDSELVNVREFALAGYVVHDLMFIATAPTDASRLDAGGVAGVLGEDFLSRLDVEFDLAAGRVRLFQPQGCSGDQVVYWAPAYFMVALHTLSPESRWLEANASLNGHEVLALFDTGAGRSTVMARVARRPGMGPAADAGSAGALHGLGPTQITTSSARFESLTIGQETFHNPHLLIADVFAAQREVQVGSYIKQSAFNEPDVIIGADFFLAHRVYIARSQGRIYFTYVGLPVFQEDPGAAAIAPATPLESPH